MTAPAREAAGAPAPDFSQAPFTVAWEVTRACALACLHCRAEAVPARHPEELTTAEAFDVIDQVADAGSPILIVTGGDPLMRPDLFEILSRAAGRGLRVALSPSATARCTRQALQRAADCGVAALHVSLDGPDAASHDRFRGVRGSFDRTLAILENIADLGIPLQVGTTVSRHSLARLPEIAAIVERYGARTWSLFFLVPTGRGRLEDMVSAREHERAFHWLYDHGKAAPYAVRTTAAMAYRRVAIQRARGEARGAASAPAAARPVAGMPASFSRGVNDGDGFAFIDHLGNVCPSGFLQLPAGNVRERPFAEIYRESDLFLALRDKSRLKGRCGGCEYREVCGGSRARAYALTGDYLEADPSCVYVPLGWALQC